MSYVGALLKVGLAIFVCVSIYFQYQTYIFQNQVHLINNEIAETQRMLNQQDMLQSAMSMHTNRLLLGIYYKDNAPQEEIYRLVMEREELVRKAIQEDNLTVIE